MPHLLRDYPLDGNRFDFLSPATAGGMIACAPGRIFLWATLTEPETPQHHLSTKPIPFLVDTGFDGNFLIGRQQLASWIGLIPSPDTLIRQNIPLGRVAGTLVADLYCFDLWAYPQVGAPTASPPPSLPFRVFSGIEVYVHQGSGFPPLLGMGALRASVANLHIDCLTKFCNFAVP